MNASGKYLLILMGVIGALTLPPIRPASSADLSFKIIINAANPVSSMEKDEVARIFLKRTIKWEDGRLIMPVDQVKPSPVRAAFSKAILDSTPAAVEAYWLKKLYSGDAVPPPEKEADADVAFYVGRNAAAIGYVSAPVTAEGVKTLTVTDLP